MWCDSIGRSTKGREGKGNGNGDDNSDGCEGTIDLASILIRPEVWLDWQQ